MKRNKTNKRKGETKIKVVNVMYGFVPLRLTYGFKCSKFGHIHTSETTFTTVSQMRDELKGMT